MDGDEAARTIETVLWRLVGSALGVRSFARSLDGLSSAVFLYCSNNCDARPAPFTGYAPGLKKVYD